MLERLVAWILNNYLGKYVENLNTDQLSIALLSGQVELENLPLKKDALRHLGLPIEIKAGFIGKVKLQIPVRQIRSAPWVILIEQLYLVAAPLPVQEWDAASEELAAQELKLSALDNIEAKWRLETENKENNATYYASTYSSWLGFGTGFVTDIIENLQLKICDVHFRYEDSVSIPNKAVAFGVTIESLSAQSCDLNWVPGFMHWDSSAASFKLLELQKLAVYWTDLDYDRLFAKLNLGQLAFAMSPAQNNIYSEHYVLAPVSAQAHIKRNRSEKPIRSHDTPRIVCDLQLEEVPMKLVNWQYEQMVKCARGLDDITRLRAYRHYRPTCTVAEDAKAWWLYAINCLYPGKQPGICRPRPTWQSCLERAKENTEYVHTYTKILLTPTVVITSDEQKMKDKVEWNRTFEELKILRELSMKSVPIQSRRGNSDSSAGRSILVSWFPQWMGWYSTSASENTTDNETTQLEGEILQALSDTYDNNTILKRDVVFGQFSFTIKSGLLNLCTAHGDAKESISMMELQFKTLCLKIISRPRSASHVVELLLGALYLKDKFTLNTIFPILVGPLGHDRTPNARSKGPSPRVSVTSASEDLFSLIYEKCPENLGCDYKLCIKSKCLDVVYQPAAIRWLTEFLCLPHQRIITHSSIQAMKSRTKKELKRNWDQILDGRVSVRKKWELQLDIMAPQIFFIEKFSDQNSAMAVIDFGRLQLSNKTRVEDVSAPEMITRENDDDEMFVTPCSTPPASDDSDSDVQQLEFNFSQIDNALNETNLHDKLYDTYNVELTEMQILIGKVKDNWRYAHNKGTSTLHVLDRFNISLQFKRRVVHTSDPMYPSLTLNATLPKLGAHLNENKIASARTLAQIISYGGFPSPFSAPESGLEELNGDLLEDDETSSVDTGLEMSRLLMLQFTVDHMALEVQSRGRSIAELQVSGVKVAFTKRPVDVSVTLTVHSLLLVDALQTFGPDFELLVASHKHVGMDSMSGSLRDSEPTSPQSPGSPDPNVLKTAGTSPFALKQALSSLGTSPPLQPWFVNHARGSSILDAEALITIEIIMVTGAEPMQIANIQFNNLDIIANQETIVELMGFIRRIFPDMNTQKQTVMLPKSFDSSSVHSSVESLEEGSTKLGTTELTFDFHRLNVLLLRGVVKDGCLYGKKICTATMSEAKIQATVENGITVEGSLGGLQVLDLTPDGHMHQRIVSVGRDPLLESAHPLYIVPQAVTEDDRKAFSFRIIRSLSSTNSDTGDKAEIHVRMASLYYTHSPQFVVELQSCATEFKQYLANLARSIKAAATDMALGLVHARTEALAQSIYMNSRLSASIYGSALSFSDIASPRRRRRSSSMEQSFSGYSSVRDTVPQTPYSPEDDANFVIDIKLDIVLDSPVLILPRASHSAQVFVAHLGKITISNESPCDVQNEDMQDVRSEHYDIEVKDMNIFSLDTSSRRVPGPISMTRPEIMYSCKSLAKPILHDTILQLNIDREVPKSLPTRRGSLPNLLLDNEEEQEKESNENVTKENLQIFGSVVTSLKVSLTKGQYEQLLDTLKWLMSPAVVIDPQGILRSVSKPSTTLTNIYEDDTGVTTLKMDPHMRAKMFSGLPASQPINHLLTLKVLFEIPNFIVELRGDTTTGEQGLVKLSFSDFVFIYEKYRLYETSMQVSLRSILMEDLLQPECSKQRSMVISSSGDELPAASACVSRSCPNMSDHLYSRSPSRGSLPTDLEPFKMSGLDHRAKEDCEYPCTPPPSPSTRLRPEKNLVLISTLLVDPRASNFKTHYKSVQRSTSVDFNCLDLVVSVESWVLVMDFFTSHPSQSNPVVLESQSSQDVVKESPASENSETNISVRSLTMVLVTANRDVARANISHIDFSIKTVELRQEVEGKLGSMSLLDLSSHGQLYRERFLTSGEQALNFRYVRHAVNESLDYDSQLKLEMSSVLYVHTKRFVAEITAFFMHFTHLQGVMAGIRAATSGQKMTDEISRLSLIVETESPVILFPVSSKSADLLICDLGQLSINNCFKLSNDPDTISVTVDSLMDKKCLLDVMYVELQNVNLFAGVRESNVTEKCNSSDDRFKLGHCVVKKRGASLLREVCHLKLQVERNLESLVCHNVPDMSIHGELSTLDCTLDESQYKLIRGFLAYNLGENIEHILPSLQYQSTTEPSMRELWILSSLRLDLLNVTVCLKNSGPLACINFIKSRLTVENFSNLSQDVDLVSQEILMQDTRYKDAPIKERANVFTNILQPVKTSKNEVVQVEIHSRKRLDCSKSTVLLNNMRLMAIFDWWEAMKVFIFQDIDHIPDSPNRVKTSTKGVKIEESNFEFKLNITDSEVVVVEDTSQWDTNAVTLKSTTVISYRPSNEKPLSCNLNNCEVYSCVLGMEDETELSIIDPVTLNIEINKDRVLETQLQRLTIRVSYNDMRMFLQILNSLPKQMISQKNETPSPPPDVQNQINKLMALGFKHEDCIDALQQCEERLDDAALWLTQNALPAVSYNHNEVNQSNSSLDISAIEVKADCLSVCIIDDCGDADVPLLELSLSRVSLRQTLRPLVHCNESENLCHGVIESVLACDYYNRVLSGWEPVVEPWQCLLMWHRALTSDLSRNRHQVGMESKDLLKLNVTSTLTELYKQVKDNWTQDFYKSKDESKAVLPSTPGYRRRSPFIPFAIKNDTGSPLQFSTLITEMEELYERNESKSIDYKWSTVLHGQTTPFSFKSRGKIRHSDSHKMHMHRLGVHVEGYQPVAPVTVDKVGIYFRNAAPSMHHRFQEVPHARIVFDVALEGSARKLVTVRSALLIVNKLKENVDIKLESHLPPDRAVPWAASKNFTVISGDSLAVPLVHAHSLISLRPVQDVTYTFSAPCISWEGVSKPGDSLYELKACHSNRGQVYRFCAEIKRENYPADRASATGIYAQPGHTITLLPTVLLVNMLPIDLSYEFIGVVNGSGRVAAGDQASLTTINTDDPLKLKVYLENFPYCNSIIIPPGGAAYTYRLKLEDTSKRKLNLIVTVTPYLDSKLKISIAVPYWIMNKTGLPLVFRQGGVSYEAAGQFEEHETARMVAPLLFSFSDPDGSPTVVTRIGKNVIPNSCPQWCSNFHLQRGCQVQRLKVSVRDGRPDTVFIIGIEVRTGRGRYRDTNIVIISPRFQLHNKSSYQLLFSQSCDAIDTVDYMTSKSMQIHLKAMRDSHMPFHWHRFDKDHLLCVLIQDIPDCRWSSGLIIDKNHSMHVNVRDSNGTMYFLRLEVVLQGATFFVVFTDANTMPPPMRIDNFSEVAIKFAQACCKDIVHGWARAHTSVPYTWDKPTDVLKLTVEAPGGVTQTYDMNNLGPVPGLTYENFIYIAFTGTFKNCSHGTIDLFDVESQELVLDVTRKTEVTLQRKIPGQRSQLWRMTTSGQLQHEGSSPPSHPHQPNSIDVYVLDIEGPAPQPSSYTRLCLRRIDPRRKSTQTWRFTEDGRLCCAHNNMCVQAQDGFYGLRQGSPVACWQPWNAAVLGLPQPICHQTTDNGTPLEQAVGRQRMRPGSGFLDVEIGADGPTKVLSVWDKKEKKKYAFPDERDWTSIAPKQRPYLVRGPEDDGKKDRKELQFTLRLAGLGISLILRKPAQELMFAQFSNIVGETLLAANKRFCISIGDIQIDNQLFEAPIPVFLHVTRPGSRSYDDDKLPALEITAEMQPILNENAVIFTYFIVNVKKMSIYLEERLLLKLFLFGGYNSKEEESYDINESDYETQQMLTEVTATHARRYYFRVIQLILNQIRLSMKTASKLTPQLQSIKRKLGLTLIKFEDAAVDLEPFVRKHLFETGQSLVHFIIGHFKRELKWQAAIYGSVDFLGNPLGFVNDISEGVDGFIREGNVGALVTNIAHGISNSAVKVTETISDGLGLVSMDEEHEEMRQKIRLVDSGRGRDHLYAGIKGLGFGVLGGATGIFKQVYEGATNEGIQGVLSGIGKGLLGAVAKPVGGVLDLASETARAVRDSSRSSNRKIPERVRPPRCVFGPGDLLSRYNYKQALGQQYLHYVNNRNYSEQLISYECLRSGTDDLRIIISNQRVRIVTNANGPNLTTVIEWHLSDLERCRALNEIQGSDERHYIEITMHLTGTSTALVYQDPVKKPRVRCDTAELANSVSQQINYSKRLYDERLQTLTSDNITSNED